MSFTPASAVTALRSYADGRGIDVNALTADSWLDLVTGFFREVAAEGAVEDRLLWEWGPHPRADLFAMTLTREVVLAGGGGGRLSVTLLFAWSPQLADRPRGSLASTDPVSLAAKVRGSEVFRAVQVPDPVRQEYFVAEA
jgi:hypothetical protein